TSAFFGSPAPVDVCASTPADWVQLPPANLHAGLTVELPKLSENRTVPAGTAGVVALAAAGTGPVPARVVAWARESEGGPGWRRAAGRRPHRWWSSGRRAVAPRRCRRGCAARRSWWPR